MVSKRVRMEACVRYTWVRTDDMVEEDVLEELIEESISGRVLPLPSFSSPRLGSGQCSRIVCRRSIVKTCMVVVVVVVRVSECDALAVPGRGCPRSWRSS